MQPSIIARHLRQGLGDYLRTTFPIASPIFSKVIDDLIEKPGGIFRGPFVSVALPFLKGERPTSLFKAFQVPFEPHVHQVKAFHRLLGATPKSTIVATGTGSGKTECFLLPVLEHCWRERQAGRPGIKAILIYP